MSVGPTLGVRGSIENLPDIRIVFDGPGTLDSYALTNALAYDVGAGLYVADRAPGWGLGSYAFIVGGVGRITSDLGDGKPLLRRRRRRGPVRPHRLRDLGQVRVEPPQRAGRAPFLYRPHQHARDGELLMSSTVIDAWLAAACADAERRGLPELKPLLEVARAIDRGPARRRRRDWTARPSSRRPTDRVGTMPDGSDDHEPGSPPDRRRRAARPVGRRSRPSRSCEACLAQIDARPEINAFITRLDAQALADARGMRARDSSRALPRARSTAFPSRSRISIDVAGVKTTSGSALPADEATTDAPAIARLRAAGAIIIGKTNLHEFAFGTTSEESAFGPVRNPLDRSRSAGGSSGGAAAALAAGMCFGALGTDTGGSIRIPSAACGTVGLKATIGEISCEGVVPLSDVARSSRADGAKRRRRRACSSTCSPDGRRARWQPRRATSALVFGVPRPYFCDRIDAGVRQALERRVRSSRAPPATPSATSRSRMPRGRRTSICTSCCPRPRAITRRSLERSPHRLLTGRPPAARDGALSPRGGLRPRHAICERRSTTEVDRALDGCDALLLPTLPIRRAAARARRRSTSTARPSRPAPRCCGSRSSSTSPAIRRSPCRRRRTSTRCRAACRSSARRHRTDAAGHRAHASTRLGLVVGSTRAHDPGVLSGVFHAWERRLAAVSTDRIVRPFEWGLEWIDAGATASAARRQPADISSSGRIRWSRSSEQFFALAPVQRLHARRRVAVVSERRRTPHRENNTVQRAVFPGPLAGRPETRRDRAAAVERRCRGTRRPVPPPQPVQDQRAAPQPALSRQRDGRPSCAAPTTSSARMSGARRRSAGRRCSTPGAASRGSRRRATSRSASSARAWARAWRC